MLIKARNRERDEKVERGREKRGRHERKTRARERNKDTVMWRERNKRQKENEKREEGKGEAHGMTSSACKTNVPTCLEKSH